MQSKCIWCGREFFARGPNLKNYYQLPSAGTQICWNCSDLYDDAEVKMHFGPLHARRAAKALMTENGHVLPFVQVVDTPGSRWSRVVGYAVDSYGKRWSLKKSNEDVLTLKPSH